MPACNLFYLSVCNAAASETLPLVDEGATYSRCVSDGWVFRRLWLRGGSWRIRWRGLVAGGFYERIVGKRDDGGDGYDGRLLDVSRSAEVLREVLMEVREQGFLGNIVWGGCTLWGVKIWIGRVERLSSRCMI